MQEQLKPIFLAFLPIFLYRILLLLISVLSALAEA
jgi:hypothetical protein